MASRPEPPGQHDCTGAFTFLRPMASWLQMNLTFLYLIVLYFLSGLRSEVCFWP